MISLPVIARELLSAARSPLQYRMRVVVGAAAVFFVAALGESASHKSGLQAFAVLHCTAVVMCLLIAPALTADTISRERREGTLDLLFLTSLTGPLVIWSKFFTQALRMVTLWVATLPVAMLPFLAGGVNLSSIVFAVCVQATCLLIGLVCGLTLSIFAVRPLTALLCSIALALIVVSATFFGTLFISLPGARSWANQWMGAMAVVFGVPLFAGRIGFGAGVTSPLLLVVAGNLLWVTCASFLWLWLLGRRLSRITQRQADSPLAAWLKQIFLQPKIAKEFLRKAMLRKMQNNPLIWLEYRTPWSRSVRGIALGLLIVGESYVLGNAYLSSEYLYSQIIAGWLVVLLVCLTVSSSFQKEKESGVFELLLVAPLNEEDLLYGRLRAVWSYYWPVALVLALFAFMAFNNRFMRFNREGIATSAHLLSLLLSGITVPVTGIYFALRFRHFFQIFASTAFCGIFLPYFAWDLFQQIAWYAQYGLGLPFASFFSAVSEASALATIATLIIHWQLISRFWRKSMQSLRTREFAI